jgi:hypothetical protein
MRQILETEEYVQIPPGMYSEPFYRITYLIKEEIRKYKWIEGEKGRKLTWAEARQEWSAAYREKFEKFLIDTLTFPAVVFPDEEPAEQSFTAGTVLDKLPHRTGG